MGSSQSIMANSGQLPTEAAGVVTPTADSNDDAVTVAVSDAAEKLEMARRIAAERAEAEAEEAEARAKAIADGIVQAAKAGAAGAAAGSSPKVASAAKSAEAGAAGSASAGSEEGSDIDGDDDDDDDGDKKPAALVTVTDEFGNERMVSAYEAARIERIRRNRERLASLGLADTSGGTLLSGHAAEMERKKEERRKEREQRKRELDEIRKADRRSSPRKRQTVSEIKDNDNDVVTVADSDAARRQQERQQEQGKQKKQKKKQEKPKPVLVDLPAAPGSPLKPGKYSCSPLYPKQDELPGWKLHTEVNPVLYISPGRNIPFRSLKQARAFAELARSNNGDEHVAFDLLEAKFRKKTRKNGRDVIFSIVAALPEDDPRRRNRPKKALSVVGVLGRRRLVQGRLEYLLRFAGSTCSSHEDAWVPKSRLDSKASKLVKAYDLAEKIKNREGPALEFLPSGFADPGTSPLVLNGGPVKMHVMAIPGKCQNRCFLDAFAPGRVFMIMYDISQKTYCKKYRPAGVIYQNGGTYTAVATRVVDQKTSSGRNFGPKRKEAHVYYVLTKGGSLPDFDLLSQLEKVANFATLPPHKIPARLEVRIESLSSFCVFFFIFLHKKSNHFKTLFSSPS